MYGKIETGKDVTGLRRFIGLSQSQFAKTIGISMHTLHLCIHISLFDLHYSIEKTQIVEEYLEFPKGPCILLVQKDSEEKPIHVVWGIPKGKKSPAVLITA